MRQGIGRALSTKRAKMLVGIVLGMSLVIAGMAPASADSPNETFKFRGHPVADAGWTTCPGGPSYIEEVCVDTGLFAGIVITQTNGTTVKEPCIAVTQFIYTFDPDKNPFISETFGELCGDAIQFTSRDLTLISASGSIPLTLCTAIDPYDPEAGAVCVPDGTATVDFTWNGYGPRRHFADKEKFQLGPGTCLWHDIGTFRDATSSGTITGLPGVLGTKTFSGISDQLSMRLSHGVACSR
jgi:hypothetical protein